MAKTRRRKKRTHLRDTEDPAKKGQPKSFVLRRGRHGVVLKDLEKDLRKLMSPNTATNLRESKKNVLRDFVSVAGPLGVTHLLLLTATQNAAYLRIGKAPRGPTIAFRVHKYSLMRDVLSSQQRPRVPSNIWLTPPLVVMNNFNVPGAEHLKLATVMFQNMFPSINVQTVKLSGCQRVLLVDYDAETERITVRHYSISAQPSGVTRNLKTLLARKKLPDLGRMTDVSEFLTKSGFGSESEGEDAEAARVELAQDLGKGNKASRQSRIRLHEIGPRLELEIIKVEEELCGGRVLYHKYQKRTKEEVAAQDKEMEEKKKLREQRRREQDANVRRKAALKSQKEEVEASKGAVGKDGKPKKTKQWWERNDPSMIQPDDVDDAEWYRKEVGEEPDEGDFTNRSGDVKKKKKVGGGGDKKKRASNSGSAPAGKRTKR